MTHSSSQRVILLLSAFMLILSPIFRAANRPLPLLAIELLGILILFIVFWKGEHKGKISKPVWLVILLTVSIPLVYLIPLPESLTLSGRELYDSISQWVLANSNGRAVNSLSLIPEKTLDSFLSLFPAVAIFIATMSLTVVRVKILCYVFIGVVGVESVLAIAQFTNGGDALYFGMPNTHNAQGTYRNRDHFVGLIEMGLPIVIGLLAISFSRINKQSFSSDFVSRFSSHETLFFGSLIVFLLLAGIFSHSRSGVFLVLLGVFISTLAFSRHIGGKQSIGLIATLTAFGLGIASSIGVIPLINRFISKDPLEDERGRIFEHTVEAIQNFYPFGTGPGTFSSVYRAFQPIEQRMFINNAHNDYLELFLETGIFGGGVLALFFILYLVTWKSIFKSPWVRFRYIQTGAGIGIFLMLLHALTDFNFHIPANMVFFAFLLGLFFHLPIKKNIYKRDKKQRINKSPESDGVAVSPNKSFGKNVQNPFSK